MKIIDKAESALNKAGRGLAINKRKAKLRNHDFTIISNTCVGGVMTHFVGEQFRSPTVNLIIWEEQFLALCNHLKEYANCPVEKLTEEEEKKFEAMKYPVGVLRGGELPDIFLLFVHYKSFEEGKAKWEERYKRINYDDIFVVMDRGIEARDEILDVFNALPYEHKVIFTHKTDPERWPCNFQFDGYTPEKYKNGLLYNNIRKGLETYAVMDEFDFVTWLNDGTIRRNPDF